MDEYSYYMHKAGASCDDQEEIIENAESDKLMQIHNELTTTMSEDGFCAMDEAALQHLLKMDQVPNRPYIDKKRMSQIKHIYAQNGKYTQYIITTYDQYDDDEEKECSLPPLPQKEDHSNPTPVKEKKIVSKNDESEHTDCRQTMEHKQSKTNMPRDASLGTQSIDASNHEIEDKLNHDTEHIKTADIDNAYLFCCQVTENETTTSNLYKTKTSGHSMDTLKEKEKKQIKKRLITWSSFYK